MSNHGGEKGGLSSIGGSDEGDSTLADLLKTAPHDYDRTGQPIKRFIASPGTSKLLQEAKGEDIAERRQRAIGVSHFSHLSGPGSSVSVKDTGVFESEPERTYRLRSNAFKVTYFQSDAHKIFNDTTPAGYKTAIAAFAVYKQKMSGQRPLGDFLALDFRLTRALDSDYDHGEFNAAALF